ncbi:WSC domain-containing protein [Aspergillus lucknowensis]|uniref:WSC domain-containing protein n=1 Tax=Aspergillus lucknowensis TaxID=176173 RepID=A0ABR4LDZ8_9EURO
MNQAVTLFAILPFASAAAAVRAPSSQGCFSDPGVLQNAGSSIFQSINHCVDLCDGRGSAYAALQKDDCWCGDALPDKENVVADDRCDVPCAGFPTENCGGDGVWSVYDFGGIRPSVPLSTTPTSTVTDSTSTPVASSTSTSSSTTEAGSETTSSTTIPDNVSETPVSTSTSVEPTPTENAARRRYSFFF